MYSHITHLSLAPVVQWIKQLRPKEKLAVRVRSGAPQESLMKLATDFICICPSGSENTRLSISDSVMTNDGTIVGGLISSAQL
jgi:hypothetical protein